MENLTKKILENVDNGIFNHVDESIANQYIAFGFYSSSGSPSVWSMWYEIDAKSTSINDVLDSFKAMVKEYDDWNQGITYDSNKWKSVIKFNIKLFNKE